MNERFISKQVAMALILAATVALILLIGGAAAQDAPAGPGGNPLPANIEPNNTPDTAFPIACGEKWFKSVNSASEVDWWVFSGNETAIMVVWVEGAEEGQPVDPRIQLYEGGATPADLVEENDDYDGKDSRLHYLTGDDDYYVKVEDLNDTQAGNYWITVDMPYYVSVAGNGKVGGVSYSAGDILVYYQCRQEWQMFLDMSDTGIKANTSNFATLDGGARFILGFVKTANLPGIGSVLPQDLVVFNATDVGPDTAGSFQWLFDGSDVGLTAKGERIDAVTVSNNELYLSTTGTASVPGINKFDNKDVVVFRGTQWGSNTAGTWEKVADGSDGGLGSLNLQGLWLNDWYLGSDDEYWYSMIFNKTFAPNFGTANPNDVVTCLDAPDGPIDCLFVEADFTTELGSKKLDAVDLGPHYHDTLPNFP